ncbi:MAG TPA: membrane protein insertase YidC, partial [Burkholderiaceae bacterium]|nr:membrane protein insertase YidC [Burkholderiaceae bacterium]
MGLQADADGRAQDTGYRARSAAAQPPIRLKTDVLAIDVDPIGGEVQRAELLKFSDADNGAANMLLFDEKAGHTYVAQTGLASATLPNHRTPFTVEPGERELAAGADTLVLKMSAEQGGARLVRTYTLKRGSYAIDVATEVTNLGGEPLRPTLYMQITRDTHKPPGESQFYSTYTGPVVYTDKDKFQKVDFSAIEKGKSEHSKDAADGWIGVIQHYFVSAWVPTEGAQRQFETAKVDKDLYTV